MAKIDPNLTINEFCAAERFSRRKYYDLKNAGLGPAETYYAGAIRITPAAHAAFRKMHERRAQQKAVKLERERRREVNAIAAGYSNEAQRQARQ